MSYKMTTLAGAFRWSFPVVDYERHDPAPPDVKQRFAGWPYLPGGVFVGVGRPLKKNGITQERGDEVFTHAFRVKTNDPDEVLKFVRRFGLLGCAETEDAVQTLDSVLYSQKFLERFQRLAVRVQTLREEESASLGRWTRLLKAIQEQLNAISVQPDFEMRTDSTGRAVSTPLRQPDSAFTVATPRW